MRWDESGGPLGSYYWNYDAGRKIDLLCCKLFHPKNFQIERRMGRGRHEEVGSRPIWATLANGQTFYLFHCAGQKDETHFTFSVIACEGSRSKLSHQSHQLKRFNFIFDYTINYNLITVSSPRIIFMIPIPTESMTHFLMGSLVEVPSRSEKLWESLWREKVWNEKST